MNAQDSSIQSAIIPPMSIQQEDTVIHTRITNDEKALRRMAKKFHNYTSLAYNAAVPPLPAGALTVDDARDAFLIELASFHLSLKKSSMVCEAEQRQVEEYQRERERIENERVRLRDQIEELKSSLELAQLHRKRKVEYDVIAEKINALPSRDELEGSIKALENDMAAIRSEHENQDRVLRAQQAAISNIISSIQDARTLGKQDIDLEEPEVTPVHEGEASVEIDVEMAPPAQEETGEIKEDKTEEETGEIKEDKMEEDQEKESDDDVPLAKQLLNASAHPFIPRGSTTPQLHSNAPTPGPVLTDDAREEGEDDDDDIEMGELAEEPKEKGLGKKKVREEELEEGEASDSSSLSELSAVPSDTEYP